MEDQPRLRSYVAVPEPAGTASDGDGDLGLGVVGFEIGDGGGDICEGVAAVDGVPLIVELIPTCVRPGGRPVKLQV